MTDDDATPEQFDVMMAAGEPVESARLITDWTAMHALIGRRVRVVLAPDDPKGTITGVLRSLSDDGEVKIETAIGNTYAWPAIGMFDLDEETQ